MERGEEALLRHCAPRKDALSMRFQLFIRQFLEGKFSEVCIQHRRA